MNASGASASGGQFPGSYEKWRMFALWEAGEESLEHLERKWGWLVAMGIALVIVGMLAISFSFITTFTTVVALGILLAVAGIVELFSSFWARCWRGFFVGLLGGVVYAVLGFLLITHPVRGAAGLTLVLAALFMATGVMRIVLSLAERFAGRHWVLLNGVVTLLLGILIWRQWPESSLWVIGLFMGIDLLFAGWSWIMLGLGLHWVRDARQ